MTSITAPDCTNLFYKDWGPKDAQPVMFHHGWPLSADDWDSQMLFFMSHGYRVIAHDRRGHGRSDQTDTGNDMDTYALDVVAIAQVLNLRDANTTTPCARTPRWLPATSTARARVAGGANPIRLAGHLNRGRQAHNAVDQN